MSRPSKLAPKLLRPNPNFEEDLAWATEVTSEIEARVKTYPVVKKRKTKRSCWLHQDQGKAPVITLNDGRRMPAFGLGTWQGFDKKGQRILVQEDAVVKAVEWAIEAGYRQFDTAHIYGTEEQVGEGIRNMIAKDVISRSDVFVTTKRWNTDLFPNGMLGYTPLLGDKAGLVDFVKLVANLTVRSFEQSLWNIDHSPKDVIPALKMSLQKLKLKYVDLYLIHWPMGFTEDGYFDNTDYLDTWRAMIEAKDRGLALSIGLSNFNSAMLDRIIACTPVRPAVLQIEINLNLQQRQLLSYCKEQGVAVTAYTPFGSIFPERARRGAPPPRCDDAALVSIASKYGKTAPQVVLRFLVELGTMPIPKSVDFNHIFENIDIFDFSLNHQERELLASYDTGYRTIPALGWIESPYYPFERPKVVRGPKD